MQTTFVCLIKYSHYQFCLIWFISHTSPGTQPIRLTNLRYHLSYQPVVVSHGTLYPHTRCSPKSLLGEDASWPTKPVLPPWSWGLLPLRETRKSQARARYASRAPLQWFFLISKAFQPTPARWDTCPALARHFPFPMAACGTTCSALQQVSGHNRRQHQRPNHTVKKMCKNGAWTLTRRTCPVQCHLREKRDSRYSKMIPLWSPRGPN